MYECDECGYEDCACDENNELEDVVREQSVEDKALLELTKLINITPELLQPILAQLSDSLLKRLEERLFTSLKLVVEKECGTRIQELSKELMTKTFTEVVESQVVIAKTNSWDSKKTTIKDAIRSELDDKLKSFYSQDSAKQLVQEAVQKMLKKDLDKIATEAVSEFKQDVCQQINKQAMQEITKAIAGVISSDNKLLAVLKA